jgi:MtrB/PioB family decaheme-associated outer membrane protein
MKALRWHHHASLTLSIATSFAAGAASPETPAPDTDSWKCTQCPFLQGYEADAEVGVTEASGANAYFGRYTGIDHGGAYADAGYSGQLRTEDGSYANYNLENLGLASRDGYIEGGREGRYDLNLSYDGQPEHLYDTTDTPFQANGGNLSLPPGWVSAGSTGGMSALGSSLSPVNIGTERRTAALLGRFFASPGWTIFGEFRRQEKDGTQATSASFLTEAVQLAQPIDYVTDSLEAGVAWSGRKASFRLTYTGSWCDDDSAALTFANPYLPIVPGSTEGRLGVPPSNELQQLAATGNVQLPWFTTTLTYAASLGTLRQNDSFLPVSTLSGATLPGSDSLNGDVHLSHYSLGLASRPLSKLNVHGTAAYDGRDDQTTPIAVSYIVTDTFPGGASVRPRYSEDRVRLDGGIDYTPAHWLRIGVGGKFNDNHYGPGQIVTNTQETQSWGYGTLTPIAPLSFSLKIGNGLRKASTFDAAAQPFEENPLVRDYDYAPRDRVFSSLTGSWAATATLAWSIEGLIAKDDYRSSPLGLQSSHEQRASTTLTWTPHDTLSAYVDAGYQRLFTLQNGYTGELTSPWLATDTERFWNVGVGGRWVPQERWTLSLDYLLAPSHEDTDSTLAGLTQAFPVSWTKLDSTHFVVAYQWSAALQVHFRYTRETYNSNDWAIDGVGPDTVSNLLSLGAQPWRDNVNVFGLTFRYQFGSPSRAGQNSK